MFARAATSLRTGVRAASAGLRSTSARAVVSAATRPRVASVALWRSPSSVGAAVRSFAVFNSGVEDVTIPETALTEYVLEHAASRGDKPAFINAVSGDVITYAELPKRIGAAAAALTDSGFKAGDVLGIHLPNCPEYAIAFHAVATLGGVVTTSNPLYTAEELSHQITDAGPRVMLTTAMFEEIVRDAIAQAGKTEDIDVVLVDDPDAFVHARDDIGIAQAPIDPAKQLVVLPYSSGTTGLPKGVMLTHRNVAGNVAQIADHPTLNVDMHEKDNILGVLPFFHIYGMVVIMNQALRVGATVVTLPKFDPELFLTSIQRYKLSYLPLVPPIVLFLAKHPIVEKFDLSTVKTIFSGAAPLDSELQDACVARLPGVSVRQGYGMTELSPVSHLNPAHDTVTGSAGRLIANTECKLVEPETGAEVEEGDSETRGEVWVRGPQVMAGYLNNQAATDETIVEGGWLRTGDMGYRTDDGHYFIVERLKELIKVKGFQVAPAELEGLLLQDPEVADCAVIAVPDERAGELPKAFVVRAPESESPAQDILARVNDRVAEFKHIAEIAFVDEIPKSASGKILKRLLRDA